MWFSVLCLQACARIWDWVVLGLLSMEDMATRFAARFAITKEKKEVVVVHRREALAFKSSRVFLVGRVLSVKPVNKERFKRQMRNLWRPKVNVVVTDLEDNRFAFGFNSIHECTTILRGDHGYITSSIYWFLARWTIWRSLLGFHCFSKNFGSNLRVFLFVI